MNEALQEILKHLPGQHDQSSHGGLSSPEPDDYRMQHQPPEDGPQLHDLLGEESWFPQDVYDAPQHYVFDTMVSGEKGSSGKKSIEIIRAVRGNPDAMVTVYRSAPEGSSIERGNWVALEESYARQHGMHPTDPTKDMPVISMQVPARHIRNGGNDLIEWGYWPDDEVEKQFREDQHPRYPAGHPKGGQFKPRNAARPSEPEKPRTRQSVGAMREIINIARNSAGSERPNVYRQLEGRQAPHPIPQAAYDEFIREAIRSGSAVTAASQVVESLMSDVEEDYTGQRFELVLRTFTGAHLDESEQRRAYSIMRPQIDYQQLNREIEALDRTSDLQRIVKITDRLRTFRPPVGIPEKLYENVLDRTIDNRNFFAGIRQAVQETYQIPEDARDTVKDEFFFAAMDMFKRSSNMSANDLTRLRSSIETLNKPPFPKVEPFDPTTVTPKDIFKKSENRSGTTSREQLAAADKIFGSFSYTDSNGVKYGAKVRSVSGGYNDSISVAGDIYRLDDEGNLFQGVGNFSRVFQDDGDSKNVYHSLFEMNYGYQGLGIGSAFTAHLENMYNEAELEHIDVSASLSVGGYAWASMGFEFRDMDQSIARRILSDVQYKWRSWNKDGLTAEEIDGVEAEIADLVDKARVETRDPDLRVTPLEISLIGHSIKTGSGSQATWPGKSAMLGNSWSGRKPLKKLIEKREKERQEKIRRTGSDERQGTLFTQDEPAPQSRLRRLVEEPNVIGVEDPPARAGINLLPDTPDENKAAEINYELGMIFNDSYDQNSVYLSPSEIERVRTVINQSSALAPELSTADRQAFLGYIERQLENFTLESNSERRRQAFEEIDRSIRRTRNMNARRQSA